MGSFGPKTDIKQSAIFCIAKLRNQDFSGSIYRFATHTTFGSNTSHWTREVGNLFKIRCFALLALSSLVLSWSTIISNSQDHSVPIGQFQSDLQFEKLDDGRSYRLTEPLVFEDARGLRWEVPSGFVSSGAQIPEFMWNIVGQPHSEKYVKAGIIHDYYTRKQARSTAATNRVLNEAMLADGVTPLTAGLFYFAADGFGKKWDEGPDLAKPIGERLQIAMTEARTDAAIATAYAPTDSEKAAWENSAKDIDYETLAAAVAENMITAIQSDGIDTIDDIDALADGWRVRVSLSTNTKSANVSVNPKKPKQGVSFTTNADTNAYYDWYKFDEAGDTVFVFIHGILSNKRTAWLNTDNGNSVFWPDLILADRSFGNPNIFLAGYYTGVDSGNYDIEDASDYINLTLRNEVGSASRAVIDFKNIVFIAHSMGGIIIRDLLVNERESFVGKNVGLVLLASPSGGSQDADRLRLFIEFLGNSAARQLATDSGFLISLDRRFKKIISDRKIPNLRGSEAIENHYVVKGIITSNTVVVSESSGGRYFNNVIRIPNSDHNSIVKPDGVWHASHLLVRDFFTREMVAPEN